MPNIYLAATSAYGLDIVVPGSDGNPVRSKVGAPNATFMAGMWGSAGDSTGGPGTIWKIDGTTGAIAPFTSIMHNSGAGLGNIVFDPTTEQFFISDLANCLIYRIGLYRTLIDSFDHGVTGRPAHQLAAVPDDGSSVDITDSSFNSEDPSTWGFTAPAREVYGLALHQGRLSYAVAEGPQIWSVGINADGSFAGDPRWELDVAGLASGNQITNIVFDPEGRMILAQRGPQVGSYDYSVFAKPQTSSVVRYSREIPDDPATPSTWVETPDSYAIGFRAALEAAVAVVIRFRLHGAIDERADFETGDHAIHNGHVFRDDIAAERESAFRAKTVVIRRIDAAVGNHHVAAAIDVDAIAVGIHRHIVHGHVIATRGENRKMSTAENGEITEHHIPAQFQRYGFVAQARELDVTVGVCLFRVLPIFESVDRVLLAIAGGKRAAIDHSKSGDRNIRQAFAVNETVAKISVATILIGRAFPMLGLIVGVHVLRRGLDRRTGIDEEMNVAQQMNRAAEIMTRRDVDGAAAGVRGRLNGFVDGRTVEIFAVANRAVAADIEK